MVRQRGLSLTGLVVSCVLLIGVAMLGFKLFPSYTEYMKVKKAVTEIARSPEARGSPKEAQAAFARRAAIDSISAVRAQDLDISKQGDQLVISASWSTRVPLFYNLSACLDFEARSDAQ